MYDLVILHQFAIPLGSNMRKSTMTSPKVKGFNAVARFIVDGRYWPAVSARVSTFRSRNLMATGPQKDPFKVPSPPTMAMAR